MLFCINSFSQQNNDSIKDVFQIKNSFHVGQVLNTYIYMDSFPKRSAAYFNEFFLGKQTIGSSYWQQHYNFPEVGVSLIAGNLGNKKQLGYTVGLVPSMIFSKKVLKKINLNFQIGFGFTWFNAPFDSVTNKFNLLIGSHITNMSIGKININHQLSNNLFLDYGFSFIHCSNGHYQIPNIGLNAPNFNMGLKYLFKDKKTICKHKTQSEKQIYKLRYVLRSGWGIHEFAETTEPIGTPKYQIYTGLFYFAKRISKINVLQLGFSAKYYTGYHKYIADSSFYDKNKKLKATVGTLFIGHEFLFPHWGFIINGGLDLYNPFYKKYYELRNRKHNFAWLSETYTSTRLGIHYYIKSTQYNLKNNAYFGLYINANSAKADFVELACGFVF